MYQGGRELRVERDRDRSLRVGVEHQEFGPYLLAVAWSFSKVPVAAECRMGQSGVRLEEGTPARSSVVFHSDRGSTTARWGDRALKGDCLGHPLGVGAYRMCPYAVL